jgi:hypothetical protein
LLPPLIAVSYSRVATTSPISFAQILWCSAALGYKDGRNRKTEKPVNCLRSDAMPSEKMISKKENGIGWMILNNPERHNAISLEMW